jgi:hypothetical protein
MLRYDPYQVFRLSKTPTGLYARQKWLGESETLQWKKDYQGRVNALLSGQLPDGSWHHATLATIRHLFGLHLTVRSTSAQIDAALSWLLEKIDLKTDEVQIRSPDVSTDADLSGLPFIPSHPGMFVSGAVLFLATIFGRESDPDVLAIYRWLSSQGIKKGGRWIDEASSHNILRAMVVHPEFSEDHSTALAVEYVAEFQTSSGDWGIRFPFYQTLNALAHLNFPEVNVQLEKGFKRLFESQNRDGTWSRSEPEWNTFLAIHALRNKGEL